MFMRVAILVLGLGLAGCSGGTMSETPPFAPSASPAVSESPSPPAARSMGSGTGARGGAATASARGEPVEAAPDPVMQARADCWMKVEGQKALRGIDQRVAYVDRCVAEQIKGKP